MSHTPILIPLLLSSRSIEQTFKCICYTATFMETAHTSFWYTRLPEPSLVNCYLVFIVAYSKRLAQPTEELEMTEKLILSCSEAHCSLASYYLFFQKLYPVIYILNDLQKESSLIFLSFQKFLTDLKYFLHGWYDLNFWGLIALFNQVIVTLTVDYSHHI